MEAAMIVTSCCSISPFAFACLDMPDSYTFPLFLSLECTPISLILYGSCKVS